MEVLERDHLADEPAFETGVDRGHEATPIVVDGIDPSLLADPLPQALVLTSIVIGLGVLALMVALCVRLYEHYGTFDVTEIRKLRG